MDTFSASSGHEFTLVRGYKEAHKLPPIDLAHDRDAGKVRALDYPSFKGDAHTFAMMLGFLRESGLHRSRWNRHLDIGGAEGYHASLFRASGLSRHSSSLDILRYENDQRKRDWFLARFQGRRIIERIGGARLRERLYKRKKFRTSSDRLPEYLNMSLWRRPIVDEMLVQDLYDLEGAYDVISAFLCLEYFDYRKLFAKVSSLLDEEGVFCFLVNYFWYPLNSTRVVGEMPYASQRMTREELDEYLSERLPSEREYALRMYDYFHQGEHPVVGDYVEEAARNNLQLVGTKRVIPNLNSTSRTPITPMAMQQYTDMDLLTVVEDVRRHNPKVTLEDLQTGWVMASFRKRTPSNSFAK